MGEGEEELEHEWGGGVGGGVQGWTRRRREGVMVVVPRGRPSEISSRAGGPTVQKTLCPKPWENGWSPGFPWVEPMGISHAGEGGGDQQPQHWARDKPSTSTTQRRLMQTGPKDFGLGESWRAANADPSFYS